MRSRIRALIRYARARARACVNMCVYPNTREFVLDRARDARMAEDIDHGG